MVLLVLNLKILPSVGLGWHGIFSEKTILPVIVLAVGPILGIVRYTRASVLDVLSKEYVHAARSRGLPEWKIVYRHVIKNSFILIVVAIGLAAANLVAGSIFIETIFNMQGFGMLAQSAIVGGDLHTSSGVLLFGAVTILIINIIVDLTYGLLDPRVRYTE
jgi:peptide/nickel transport system permease protein